MFLVKREESRNFDVFFGYFLVFKREKKKMCREAWQKANFKKMWSFFGLRGA